jgi:DNA-binding response OmpR family regulator
LNGTVLAVEEDPMKGFAAQQPGQGMDVEKTVAVLEPDKNQYGELRSVLEEEHYRVQSLQSMESLPHLVGEGQARALILDLDLVSVDNRSLKELRKHNPGLCIIVLSGRSFHPELKEALSHYIDACFSRPVEWEDLLYYLRGALNNAVKKGPQPDLLE